MIDLSRGAKIAQNAGYICSDCATALGGVWPQEYRGTFHEGACKICLDVPVMLASWSDWDWPTASARDT